MGLGVFLEFGSPGGEQKTFLHQLSGVTERVLTSEPEERLTSAAFISILVFLRSSFPSKNN